MVAGYKSVYYILVKSVRPADMCAALCSSEQKYLHLKINLFKLPQKNFTCLILKIIPTTTYNLTFPY